MENKKKYNFEKFKNWLKSNEWLLDYNNCSQNLKPLHNYIVKVNENEWKKNISNESNKIVEEINNIFGLKEYKSELIYNSFELEIIKKWIEVLDNSNNSQELQFQLDM
ncbi:MAG: hypothetical protein AM1032_000059 [Mycoplasmataceae bacterium]|nr:MAG: hypothetical protein AM1032_000059 [Mycoplasmataceae bacterium]